MDCRPRGHRQVCRPTRVPVVLTHGRRYLGLPGALADFQRGSRQARIRIDEAARTERRLQGLPGISPGHGVAYRHECRRTIHRTATDRCREVAFACPARAATRARSEEHTSELQSLMRISYAVLCLTKKTYDK